MHEKIEIKKKIWLLKDGHYDCIKSTVTMDVRSVLRVLTLLGHPWVLAVPVIRLQILDSYINNVK